jgi:hypothetical protein
MRKLLIVCLLFWSNVGITQAAAFWDGTKLFQLLTKDLNGSEDYISGAGAGYVTGVADASVGVLFCPPVGKGGITISDTKKIVYVYLQKHTGMWNLPADQSVIAALAEIYPCIST